MKEVHCATIEKSRTGFAIGIKLVARKRRFLVGVRCQPGHGVLGTTKAWVGTALRRCLYQMFKLRFDSFGCLAAKSCAGLPIPIWRASLSRAASRASLASFLFSLSRHAGFHYSPTPNINLKEERRAAVNQRCEKIDKAHLTRISDIPESLFGGRGRPTHISEISENGRSCYIIIDI